MHADYWARVEGLIAELAELPPIERVRVLEARRGNDPDVVAEVDSLLASAEGSDGFLDTASHPGFRLARRGEVIPSREQDVDLGVAVEHLLGSAANGRGSTPGALDDALSLTEADAGALAPPTHIGPYRIVRELGRGGMGIVYLAERDEPGLRKTVAIKVVRLGMDSTFTLRRFRNETQILATLEHPGIARLYDGGTTGEGLRYFVMEDVDGRNLLDYCEGEQHPIAVRLRLFGRVCNAVQFAHQSFVVHRDLKPSNILVTADGNPKLLDFGIAKLANPAVADDVVEETAPFAQLLTPQYPSPEAVRGEPVTTASDVYSLGVILYELLSGRRPYRVQSRDAAVIRRVVCDEEPLAPSAGTSMPLRRQLRGDLDNIVLKALRKSPPERYATAADLAEDVERYLGGFPVRARPNRQTYRAAKFVRRHRIGVVATAAAAIALVAGLALIVSQVRVARAERDRARVEAVKAQQVSQFLRSLFESSYPRRAQGEPLTARDLLDTGAARVDRELATQPEALASMLALLGSVYSELGLYSEAMSLLEKSLQVRELPWGKSTRMSRRPFTRSGV